MEIKSIDGLAKVAGSVSKKNPINMDFQNKLMEFMGGSEDKKGIVDASAMGDFLTDSIKTVSDAQFHADNMNRKLILGETDNLHEVMIANEKADLTLNFAIEVKNKIVDAYKEIMRIQV